VKIGLAKKGSFIDNGLISAALSGIMQNLLFERKRFFDKDGGKHETTEGCTRSFPAQEVSYRNHRIG
jgi:hypothetical protein